MSDQATRARAFVENRRDISCPSTPVLKKMDSSRDIVTEFKTRTYTHLPGLNIDYLKLLDSQEASELFITLEREIEYLQDEYTKIVIRGREYPIPRQHAAYGDKGVSYRFSKLTLPTKPWIPSLEQIRDRIQKVTGYSYNYVLVNRYSDGRQCIGFHADDEAELDRTVPITALSLGQERPFTFKHNTLKDCCITLKLESGSLLLMNSPTNDNYKHSLPRRLGINKPRISLTFRRMLQK
jgi:alpha-ketoglutarate-dependent dioxygenase alkB family protein 2